MKKNIVIVVLIVVTALSSVYAFIQQTKAKVAQKLAEQNLVMAVTAQKQADANAVEAMHQQQLAIKQRALALAALEKCMKRK